MKDVLLRSYPDTDPEKVHILPWGSWEDPVSQEDVRQDKARLLARYPAAAGQRVLLTLSRISPEKGQDRLLKALALWENRPDYPKEGVTLFIAGEQAYMLTIDPQGLKLVPKGKRNGLELTWQALASGDAALAQALNASVGQARE